MTSPLSSRNARNAQIENSTQVSTSIPPTEFLNQNPLLSQGPKSFFDSIGQEQTFRYTGVMSVRQGAVHYRNPGNQLAAKRFLTSDARLDNEANLLDSTTLARARCHGVWAPLIKFADNQIGNEQRKGRRRLKF
jgi:hypothetical protein